MVFDILSLFVVELRAMTRWFLFILLVPVLVFIGCTMGRYESVQRGPSSAAGDFQFSVDYALFQTARDTIGLAFYLKFPNTSLTFVKEEDGFSAAYAGTIIVNTLSGRQVISRDFEGRIEALSYGIARSSENFEYRELHFEVIPETYSIAITLQDRNSQRKGVVQRIIDVAPFPQDRVSLSGIVFAEAIEEDSSGGFLIVRQHKVFRCHSCRHRAVAGKTA